MEKNYSFKEIEERIYKMWEDGGYFAPSTDKDPKLKSKKPFTVLLPPPNANAPLHLGHAMYTVEDILVRWHRMMGDPTLWLPGSDHAGFETQVVYEKALAKEGKSRFDFDRETLYKNIWEFVQSNKSTMESQVRRLGFSLDWPRMTFTLDPKVVKTTYDTFKKLFDDGLVYRDARLVNYCTKHGTGFSDLEVDHEERDGFLYYIKFPVEGEEALTIATARPETIPGDVGVAVHPKDKRYAKYVGKTAINPVNGNRMPIIADEFVKKDFGTGIVKLTSAHDENDFDVCRKHKLPLVQVIGFDGKLTKEAGEFAGLKMLDAREKIIEHLKEKGFFVKADAHKHSVSLCYKCGTVLEPLPLPQWYVKTKPLAKKAIEAVKSGVEATGADGKKHLEKIKIIPKRFEKVYFNWLENIRDWNISRQIVWGIRIPAWQCGDCGEWSVLGGEASEAMGAKLPEKCEKCGSSNLKQDTDTFDTWFSSGQWPFATLGYPDGEDYKYFYPTSVMETGYDILFFWVARMIMLGLYVTGKPPFGTVYLHGIVRDPKGQKMSKSKGNVVDPIALLDKYGADAVRMALIVGTGAGNDQSLSEAKIVGYRNFANKVWNIARFVLTSVEGKKVKWVGPEMPSISTMTHSSAIVSCYTWMDESNKVIKLTNEHLNNFRLSKAAEVVYNFVWHSFADNYIEVSKQLLEMDNEDSEYVRGALTDLLDRSLKLLHPFMPFVTEEIWGLMPKKSNEPLIISEWPR